MQTRRQHRARSESSLLSKDPYGLIWVALIYLALMGVKWWFFSPKEADDTSCVACAVAVIWLVSVLLHTSLIFYWVGWSKSNVKGPLFVFILSVLCLILAIVDFYLMKFILNKLLYAGVLNWQESQAFYLFDVFVPHSIGLLLITTIAYSMVRVLFCRDLVQKPLVYTFVVIVLLAVGPLYFMGIKVY